MRKETMANHDHGIIRLMQYYDLKTNCIFLTKLPVNDF